MSAERDALRKKIFAAMEAAEASEAKVVVEASEALVKAFVEPFAAINRAFAAPMRAAEKLFGPLKELEAFVEPLGVLVDALISECAKKTRKAKPRSSYRSAPARCGGRRIVRPCDSF